jgi:hypothetical protein
MQFEFITGFISSGLVLPVYFYWHANFLSASLFVVPPDWRRPGGLDFFTFYIKKKRKQRLQESINL